MLFFMKILELWHKQVLVLMFSLYKTYKITNMFHILLKGLPEFFNQYNF